MAGHNQLFAGLLIAAVCLAASACGFTVHIAITHRAVDYFTDAGFVNTLTKNRGALEAGSPYPDYLYQCGANHDDGEYTHWSPFQYAAANYFRQRYTQPWNTNASVFASFVTGVVSHYIADLNWHGLAEVPETGGAYGMIETVGMLDFNCTGPLGPMICGNPPTGGGEAPHSLSDTGGEFLAAYTTTLPDDDPNTWVIPTTDLLGVYASVNRTDVTSGAIEECAVEFYAGAEAIRALGALVEALLVAPSPTFSENFLDLPCGGIDDMAVYASRMWSRWFLWLTQGPPTPPPGHEYCPGVCDESDTGMGIHSGTRMMSHDRAEGQRLLKDLYRVLGPALRDSGLVTHAHESGMLKIERATVTNGRSHGALRAEVLTRHLRAVLSGRTPSPRHPAQLKSGWTAVQDDDSAPSAVAGKVLAVLRAGGLGSVLHTIARRAGVVDGTGNSDVALLLALLDTCEQMLSASSSSPLADSVQGPIAPASTIASGQAVEYAGQAMAAGDFNGDGSTDVVITGYGHTSSGPYMPPNSDTIVGDSQPLLPQAGALYVRYAGTTPPPSGTVPLSQAFPSISNGSLPFTRLGWAACTLDFNADGVDDLAVSAPAWGWDWTVNPWDQAPNYAYLGAVLVYYGSKGSGLPLSGPANVSIMGITNFTNAGTHLQCADVNGDGTLDLLIGSPMAMTDLSNAIMTTQAGRLDIFLSSATYASSAVVVPLSMSLNSANYSMQGSGPAEWYGYSTAVLSNATQGLDLTHEAAVLMLLFPTSASATVEGCKVAALEEARTLDKSREKASAAVALVIVGAPGYRSQLPTGDVAAVGRVYGLAIPHTGTPAARFAACARAAGAAVAPTPVFSLTADAWLTKGQFITTKLGHGVAVGYPLGAAAPAVLAVGMTAVDFCNSSGLLPNTTDLFNSSAGSVTLLQVSPALKGDLAWSDVTGPSLSALMHTTILAAALPDARFGWRLGYADVNGDGIEDLLVGAPMFSPGFFGSGNERSRDGRSFSAETGREAGALFVYQGNETAGMFPFPGVPVGAPSGMGPWGDRPLTCASADTAWLRLEGGRQFGRFGTSWLMADLEGAGSQQLLVSAPRAAVKLEGQADLLEMPGAVYLYEVAGILLRG